MCKAEVSLRPYQGGIDQTRTSRWTFKYKQVINPPFSTSIIYQLRLIQSIKQFFSAAFHWRVRHRNSSRPSILCVKNTEHEFSH